MKSQLMTLADGFYAVFNRNPEKKITVTAYYSLGKLVAVQSADILYVSENYWLDASKQHLYDLKNTYASNIAVQEVALDILEHHFGIFMKEIA